MRSVFEPGTTGVITRNPPVRQGVTVCAFTVSVWEEGCTEPITKVLPSAGTLEPAGGKTIVTVGAAVSVQDRQATAIEIQNGKPFIMRQYKTPTERNQSQNDRHLTFDAAELETLA
jgi:hypothetical protein